MTEWYALAPMLSLRALLPWLLIACASTPQQTRVDVNVTVIDRQHAHLAQPPRAPHILTTPSPPPTVSPRIVTSSTPPSSPAPPTAPRCGHDGVPPAPVTRLVAGPRRTCTLHEGGAVCCWGLAPGARYGTSDASAHLLHPAPFEGLAPVTALGLGTFHGCALHSDGTVSCWGGNTYGELGDGSRETRSTPGPVPGLGGVVELAVGQWHTCVRVQNGTVRCWGGNLRSLHGTTGIEPDAFVPERVEGLDRVRALAMGVDSCAILTDRTLRCWGDRHMYNYHHLDRVEPHFYTVRSLHDLDEVALAWPDVSVGDTFACARTRDGRLLCWGGRYDAPSPDPDEENPPSRPANLGNIRDARALALGGDHGCVLRANGKVWCWGANHHGQLGDGSTVDRTLPVEVSGFTDVVEVSAAEGHTCARRTDGSVWCWGENRNGQLGAGDTADHTTPVAVRW